MDHQMHLAKTYPTGAQHWTCPTCGREVIWQFPPLKLKNVVLVDGDQTVAHSGSKEVEGLDFSGLQVEDGEFFDPDLRDQINDVLEDFNEQSGERPNDSP